MDELSSRVAMLQRLSPVEFDALRLRCDGRTTAEIAARRGAHQREILFHLAHAYDTLWLTHLDRDARQDRLDGLCAAASYIHANELPPSRSISGAQALPLATPPQAAVMAVIADEQRLIARRGSAPVDRAPIIAVAPSPEPEPDADPNTPAIMPADRDATLARLTIFSLAIVAVLVFAIVTVFAGNDDDSPIGLGGSSPATAAPIPTRRPFLTPSPEIQITPTAPASTSTVVAQETPSAMRPTEATATAEGVADVPTAPVDIDPTATAEPVPTEAPMSATLYQADWNGGLGEWTGTGNWTTENGVLINEGGQGSAAIYSPFQPTAGTSYAVEAEMQIDTTSSSGAITGFAIGDPANPQSNALRVATYWIPDTEWHTYRLEINGNTVTLLIDGQFAGEITDAAYSNPGRLGIYTNASRLQVRRFEVIG